MRIIYWNTSCLQPELEAVSKEVFQLARHFRNSLLFGINPHYLFCASIKNKYIGFHPAFDPLLRALIPLVERSGDINHVYGEPTPWTFYKTLWSQADSAHDRFRKGVSPGRFFGALPSSLGADRHLPQQAPGAWDGQKESRSLISSRGPGSFPAIGPGVKGHGDAARPVCHRATQRGGNGRPRRLST